MADRLLRAAPQAPDGGAAGEVDLRAVVEGCPWLALAVAAEGVVRWAGPAVQLLLGWPAEEVAGRLLVDLVHPHDLPALGSALLFPARGARVRLARRGGAYRPFELVSAGPLKDGEGVVLYGRELDELAEPGDDAALAETLPQSDAADRVKGAITRAAREWQLTFDSIELPILLLDGRGRVQRMNRAAMELSGAGYRDRLGRRVVEVGPGEPWRAAAEAAEAARATGAALSRQATGSDGRTWDLAASLVRFPLEPDDRVIVVAREISETVRLQESLRYSQLMSAMGVLVGGVAHEVRNPLFGISAALDAFTACFGERAEYQEYIDVFRSQVDRLNGLMRDLLEYGKPPGAELLPGALAEVLAEGVAACAPLASRAGVEVACRVAAPLPPVRMDRGRLVQVFHNLVENAVQHSTRGGRVRVAAAADGDWIVCTVEDSGPGFAEGDLERLFEPFFSRRHGGTGLGLSIVQRIVEEHRGRIAAGNLPGGGAVLELRLPAADSA
ncbi:MAG TPA: ATP-binding protein [Thermoanaerobaculia bacterium]|nr:ATP-binding protein [Thermoanaerobaculia bacterium]